MCAQNNEKICQNKISGPILFQKSAKKMWKYEILILPGHFKFKNVIL